MQVIGCQLNMAWEDKRANFERVRAMLRETTVQPGAMIVLPEMFATGFSFDTEKIAEQEAGETKHFLSDLAFERQCLALGGVATRGADGKVRNQALVIGPDRHEVARYSKQRPFTLGGEAEKYAAGKGGMLFDWSGFRVAPLVCYDIRFPETIRPAVRRGAEVIVVIASWPDLRDSHWLTLLRARAIESQAFVVGVNRAGRDPLLGYVGHSLIVAPDGETLAAAGEEEQIIEATLDRDRLVEYRRRFPFLNDIGQEGEFAE